MGCGREQAGGSALTVALSQVLHWGDMGRGVAWPAGGASAGSLGHSLQKARLVLLLIVRAKLDLTLEPSKLAGLVEGDRVGAVQNVITSLRERRRVSLGHWAGGGGATH